MLKSFSPITIATRARQGIADHKYYIQLSNQFI